MCFEDFRLKVWKNCLEKFETWSIVQSKVWLYQGFAFNIGDLARKINSLAMPVN